MKGRFGLTTTLVLLVIALVVTITDSTGNYAQYINRMDAGAVTIKDTLIAFAALMGIRSLFLLFTARTRTSSWMAALALLAFATAVLWYPFTIGAVVVGLAAFGVARKAESKLPPWRWLSEPPPETK